MTDALLSELLIAAFAAMVAVVIMRKHTPRIVEVLLWAGLVWVCFLGVTGLHDKQARDLTSATLWGVAQMVGSLIQVGIQSLEQGLIDNRFVIADGFVLIAGIDLLVLAFLNSRRQANGWQPQVRLRDWMELPRLSRVQPAPVRISAIEELNERFNVWAPIATAAALTWTTFFLIWSGDVAAPAVGRRIKKVADGASVARRRVADADWSRVMAGQVVDIGDIARRAAAIRSRATTESNWFGGSGLLPTAADGGIDSDGTQRDERDELAS